MKTTLPLVHLRNVETIDDIIAEKRRCADKMERNLAAMMKSARKISDKFTREVIAVIRKEADRIENAYRVSRNLPPPKGSAPAAPSAGDSEASKKMPEEWQQGILTLDDVIDKARADYTVHHCGQCTHRKNCEEATAGFDSKECREKRMSIMLQFGIDDGYFTELLKNLDEINAFYKRKRSDYAKIHEALTKCYQLAYAWEANEREGIAGVEPGAKDSTETLFEIQMITTKALTEVTK